MGNNAGTNCDSPKSPKSPKGMNQTMAKREAEYERATKETSIKVKLSLDGSGQSELSSGIGFLDHQLELFAKHGFFDLYIKAQGDLHVDFHHTVEDIGICLGEVLNKAIEDKSGIRRFGSSSVPMYEALANVDLDICGRPYLVWNTPIKNGKIGEFDAELLEELFHGFVNHSQITLHVNVPYGKNLHHIAEAIIKAFAKALDQATSIEPRVSGVLSTKGKI